MVTDVSDQPHFVERDKRRREGEQGQEERKSEAGRK